MAGGKSGKDLGLLILRLALGAIMMAHGIQKLTGLGLKGFTDSVANLGIPKPEILAPLAVGAECLGGLLVILGLFSQLGAVAIACTMAVAVFYAHLKNGFFIPVKVEQAGNVRWGYEYHVALIAMALCILLAGPGSIRLFPKKGPKPGGP